MKGESNYGNDCPIRLVLDRIADKWTILVVSSLLDGTKRFGELRKEIDGISQKMLTQTLKGMERDGLVIRTAYPIIPPKVEYSLSELGQSLIGILLEIRNWSHANIDEIVKARDMFDAEHSQDDPNLSL